MNPLKTIMINTGGISKIKEILEDIAIAYEIWEEQRELRVDIDEIINIKEVKSLIEKTLKEAYAYNDEEIEKVYKEYDYIVFY